MAEGDDHRDDDPGRIERVEQALRRLEGRMERLEAALQGLRKRSGPDPQEVPHAQQPAAPSPPGLRWQHVAETDAPQAQASSPTPRPTPAPRPAPTPPPERPARSTTDLERMLGENALAKAGIVVFVLGVVFFLRYAFVNDWIGPLAQIGLGVLGGLVLATIGDILARRGRAGTLYPQVLTGGGAAIVYFSVFAAYTFPRYRDATGMTLEVAALGLGLVGLGLALYATRNDTPTLAGVAVVLGFLTVAFGQEWTSFAIPYTAIFTVALLAAAAHRDWAHVGLAAHLAGAASGLLLLTIGDLPLRPLVWTLLGLAALAVAAAERRDWLALTPTAVVTTAVLLVIAKNLDLPDGDLLVADLILLAGGTALARGDRHPQHYHTTVALLTVIATAVLMLPLELGGGHVALWGALLPSLAALALVAGPDGVRLAEDAYATRIALLATTLGLAGIAIAAAGPDTSDTASLTVLAVLLVIHIVGSRRVAADPWPDTETTVGIGILAQAAATFLVPWLAAWPVITGIEGAHGPVTLALGLSAVGAALLARGHPTAPRAGWAAAGVFLLLVWPPIQFEGVARPVAWAVFVVLAGLYARAARNRAGDLIVGAAALVLILHMLIVEATQVIDDGIAFRGLLSFSAATAAYLVVWSILHRAAGGPTVGSRLYLGAVIVLPALYLGLGLEGTTITLAWAIEAVILIIAGFALGIADIRLAAIALFGIVLVRVFLFDLAGVDPIWRFVTFLVVGALLLGVSFLYARMRGKGPGEPSFIEE